MTLASLAIIGLTIVLVVRRFQVHATLFLSGFALLTLAWAASFMGGRSIPELDPSPTGWFPLDLFAIVSEGFSTRVAGIGMIVMAAGGFARYMSHIHASTALVRLAVRPLARVKSPYVLLGLAYAVGQILNIFVPSAAGLAMLLLVALYPTLVQVGLRPVAVAAVLGTTACLDLGPASGASNVAASVSGLEPVVYFVRHQVPVALIVIPGISLLHIFWQRYCDRRFPEDDSERLTGLKEAASASLSNAPLFYAILPVLPLLLLLVFSPLLISSIRIDVVTAMLVSLFIGLAAECLRLRSLREGLAGIVQFFQGMGEMFAKVVTLIVAAETFATGVKATGLVADLIERVQLNGQGGLLMGLVLVLLIGLVALITGSGNAALFSFANMLPGIAREMGLPTVLLMLPTQLAAGLFRSLSPVSGVIIAVASTAGVSPFSVVRRTSVPMLGGVVLMFLASRLLT